MSKATVITEFRSSKSERETALRHARRQIILNGAWTVFVKVGFDGATMRTIATASGCTTGAIYPLFASKELIYAALLAESLTRLNAAVTAAMASAGGPDVRLRAGASAFVDYYRDRPDEVALGLYLWNGVRPRGLTPALDRDLNRRLTSTLDLLGDAIAGIGAVEASILRSNTSALFAFLIGVLVVFQTGRLHTLGPNLDEVVTTYLDMLLNHFGSNKRKRRERIAVTQLSGR